MKTRQKITRPSSKKNTLSRYKNMIEALDTLVPRGKVIQVNGLSILTEGPPDISVGDLAKVETANAKGSLLSCEVVGFKEQHLILMPLGSPIGVFPDAQVFSGGKRLCIPVSDQMIGRIFNGIGRPLDHRSPIVSEETRFADAEPPLPTSREPIRQMMETGIRSIDSLISIGTGQRIGIFSGTGVGKSTLLGMIARSTKADLNIICLVGERGREVREFVENDLGEDGLNRSVIFAATSDCSAMEKVYAAGFATSTAEFFRDQGLHVNLYLDSITRYVMALREIGIASGEQLGTGGFPPGVWYRLSRLLERAGNISHGSITGIYTVLVERDDMTEPIADNTRSILDGHIILSRRLALAGHYPAVEVVDSISRVMDQVVSEEHKGYSSHLRRILAAYRENEELIQLGAYARGSNPSVDEALNKMNSIRSFLCQDIKEASNLKSTLLQLASMVKTEEMSY